MFWSVGLFEFFFLLLWQENLFAKEDSKSIKGSAGDNFKMLGNGSSTSSDRIETPGPKIEEVSDGESDDGSDDESESSGDEEGDEEESSDSDEDEGHAVVNDALKGAGVKGDAIMKKNQPGLEVLSDLIPQLGPKDMKKAMKLLAEAASKF